MALFRDEVKKQVLQDFLGYSPKQKDGSSVEAANITIATLDT